MVAGQVPEHRVHGHIDEPPIAPLRGGGGHAGPGSGLAEREVPVDDEPVDIEALLLFALARERGVR